MIAKKELPNLTRDRHCLLVASYSHNFYWFVLRRKKHMIHVFCENKLLLLLLLLITRMHSSRIRTTRSSCHLLGGVCLSACWDAPPGCGPGDPPSQTPQPPPRCGPGDPPARPPTSPLGVGLETLPAPSPWTEFLTHASENITLPQLRCGR